MGTEDSNVIAARRSTIDYDRLRIAINQLAEVVRAIAAKSIHLHLKNLSYLMQELKGTPISSLTPYRLGKDLLFGSINAMTIANNSPYYQILAQNNILTKFARS